MSNTGYCNAGNYNTGNYNTGNYNTGNNNAGDCNTGNCNAGNCNAGDRNAGNYNAGNRNTGNCNAGNCNAGHRNTGNYNTGNYNTGNYNAGNYNAGHRNTGNYNTGNYNTGNYNAGWFNTNEPNARFFNKECDFTITELSKKNLLPYIYIKTATWISFNGMSEQEKKDIPYASATGGYLKTIPYKEAFQDVWKTLDNDNKQKFLNLPNFDPVIFKEITGVDVSISETQKKALELEQEAEKLLNKARELRSSL